jgi:hypothetical protein
MMRLLVRTSVLVELMDRETFSARTENRRNWEAGAKDQA